MYRFMIIMIIFFAYLDSVLLITCLVCKTTLINVNIYNNQSKKHSTELPQQKQGSSECGSI